MCVCVYIYISYIYIYQVEYCQKKTVLDWFCTFQYLNENPKIIPTVILKAESTKGNHF